MARITASGHEWPMPCYALLSKCVRDEETGQLKFEQPLDAWLPEYVGQKYVGMFSDKNIMLEAAGRVDSIRWTPLAILTNQDLWEFLVLFRDFEQIALDPRLNGTRLEFRRFSIEGILDDLETWEDE